MAWVVKKCCGLLLLVGSLWLLTPWQMSGPRAEAAPLCRSVAEHQVCVLKITRSAKYYWEYRAEVQVDDVRRPMGRYNCRTGEYVSRDGRHVSGDIATQVICGMFKH